MVVSIIVSASVAAVTASIAGLPVVANTLIAAGIATFQALIERHRKKPSPRSSSASRRPNEIAIAEGVRPAHSVIGRQRIDNGTFMLAHVWRQDVGNNRRVLHLIHVVSAGAIEGLEEIIIDGKTAMRGTPDGTNQHWQPSSAGLAERWRELRQEDADENPGRNKGRTERAADKLKEEIDEETEDKQKQEWAFIAFGPQRVSGGINATIWGPECQAFIYPDGTQNVFSQTSDIPEWKSSYKARGLAVVHLWLEKSDLSRAFTGIPQIEYVVKGRKLTWLGNVAHSWTQNTAAVQYWFHRERLNYDASAHDRTTFNEAFAECAESVTFSDIDDSYTSTINRYNCNGVFIHDPQFNTQYIDEMNQCWQGAVVPMRGNLYYMVGKERAPVMHFGPENIARSVDVKFQPAITERVNTIRTALQQSIDNDFRSWDIPPIKDDDAITNRDKRTLELDLQTMPFVLYPMQAINNMTIFLRKARNSVEHVYDIKMFPTDFKDNTYSHRLKVLERVTLSDPEIGWNREKFEIRRIRINDDWTYRVWLRHAPDGEYADTTQIPPITPRKFLPPTQLSVPRAPTGLSATFSAEIINDGSLIRTITVSWNANGYATDIIVYDASGSPVGSASASGNDFHANIRVDANGEYEIEARHSNQQRKQSEAAVTTVSVSSAGLTPPAPIYASHDIRGNDVIMFFRPYAESNFDVAGMEIRYRINDLTSTTAFPAAPTTEAEWEALPALQAESIVPSVAGRNFSVTFKIPFSGRYKFYLRSVTRQGQISNITELNEFILSGARPANTTINLAPGFPGTLTNLNNQWNRTITLSDGTSYELNDCLFADSDAIRNLTRDDLNGKNGWPFSSRARPGGTNAKVYRVQPAVTLPQIGTYKVKFSMKLYFPTFAPQVPTTGPNRGVWTMAAYADGRQVVASQNVGGAITSQGTDWAIVSNDFRTYRNVNEIYVGCQLPTSTAILEYWIFVEAVV